MKKTDEKKKEHILHIATQCFNTNGYDKTALVHIAKNASVSLATIYSLFENKEILFMQCLNHDIEKSCQDLVVELSNAKTPIEKLSVVIEHKFNYFLARKTHIKELLTKNPMFLVQVGLGDDSPMKLIIEIIASVFSELDKQLPLVSKDFVQHAYNFKAITNGYIERWANDEEFDLNDKKSEIIYLLLKGVSK